jgi:hypothetical protein
MRGAAPETCTSVTVGVPGDAGEDAEGIAGPPESNLTQAVEARTVSLTRIVVSGRLDVRGIGIAPVGRPSRSIPASGTVVPSAFATAISGDSGSGDGMISFSIDANFPNGALRIIMVRQLAGELSADRTGP